MNCSVEMGRCIAEKLKGEQVEFVGGRDAFQDYDHIRKVLEHLLKYD